MSRIASCVLFTCLLVSSFPADAEEVQQFLVIENNLLWTMDTNGHRVSKVELETTFGMRASYLYDPSYDVLWVVGGGKFGVYDLREKAPKAQVLVEKVSRGVQNLHLSMGAWQGSRVGSPTELQYGQVVFVFSYGEGKVQARVENVRMGEDTGATARLVVGGEAWLKAQSSRTANGKALGPLSFSEKAEIELPMNFQNCEEAGWCGRAVPFVGNGLKLVFTEYSCGDGCYAGCHVRNSRGEMAQPPNLSSWAREGVPAGVCQPYFVAPGGVHFGTVEEMCRLEKGDTVTCKRAPGIFLGWIHGGIISE